MAVCVNFYDWYVVFIVLYKKNGVILLPVTKIINGKLLAHFLI